MKKILIGNAFPTNLIRRRVVINPFCIFVLKAELENNIICSFWGHRNTLTAANKLLGIDLTPVCERPAIALNSNQYPEFNGCEFRTCWILSPNYVDECRPQVGEEVSPDKIVSWQVLKFEWN